MIDRAIGETVRQLKPAARQIIAIALLLGAGGIVSVTYTTSFLWIFTREVSYAPDFVSALLAVGILVPFLRTIRLIDDHFDFFTVLILMVYFYLTAAVVNISLGGSGTFFAFPALFSVGVAVMAALVRSRFAAIISVFILPALTAANFLSASKTFGKLGLVAVLLVLVATFLVVDFKRAGSTRNDPV